MLLVLQGRKNRRLLQYSSRELLTVIESIYADGISLQLDDMSYAAETGLINDPVMAKWILSIFWVRKFLDCYLEITVKLITHIDRQRKTVENPELFCHCFPKVHSFSLRLYGF